MIFTAYQFYGLFTAYLLYEEAMSVRLYGKDKKKRRFFKGIISACELTTIDYALFKVK